MSYLRELGPLAVASRLKNLSDKLLREMVHLYKKHHIDFNPRWFTFVHLLSTKGPMGITSAARLLSQTHPAANQVANALEENGYIFSSPDQQDSRMRIVALTAKGELLVQDLGPLWEAVENAAVHLLEQSSPSFMKELEMLEKQLEIRSMEERIEQELKNLYSERLRLIPYKPSLKSHFKTLNSSWLLQDFMVEKEDERLLDDPEGAIIQPGGAIIFAAVKDKVIGTGALLPLEDGSAEITKMTVKEGYRRYGFGRRILQYLIKEAEMRGYKKIILFTSEQLGAAVSLYRSAGFVEVPVESGREIKYSRLSIQMIKTIL